MNLELTEKTALVSGSTKGIGFAIAVALAREGTRVVVNGRSEKSIAEAQKKIAKAVPDAKVEGFAGDLSTAAATTAISSASSVGGYSGEQPRYLRTEAL